MATNKRLRDDLLARLKVSPQRLSQLVAEVKTKHGPMSTTDGTYVLAHMRGMDLSKYLDQETRDRIWTLVPRGTHLAAQAPRKAPPAKATKTISLVRVDAGPALDLLLSPTVADDAKRMAELYSKLYVLENSIRSLIHRVMTAAYGRDWWSSKASSEVRKTVEGRKAREDKEPWHGKRGAHELYYTDFADLGKLIQTEWVQFKPVFHKQSWCSRLEELEPARNTIAHHNPVPENERKRFEVFVADWSTLVTANRAAIPGLPT